MQQDCTIDESLDTEKITRIIGAYEQALKCRTYHHLGYPYNLDYDYKVLKQLVDYSINNLGDPFIPSNYGVHSRQFEIAVLKWFAKLWMLGDDQYWGYITSCGTEGNLHGILLGREMMGTNCMLVGSRACHYSVWKAGRMYKMPMKQIATLENDEIDYTDLRSTLHVLKQSHVKIVMVINVGSTVRGAVDKIELINDAFSAHGYVPQRDYYIHVDGALFGMMMPFLPSQKPDATYNFSHASICSISVSGHKFIGSPVPCGVIMTRKAHIEVLSQDIEYINSKDATILGSRNGHAPLFLWYAIAKKGLHGFAADVATCMENARYMADKMKCMGVYDVALNELSSTVVFKKPMKNEFIQKWQLACYQNIAHVVVMPNVTREKIDEFIQDYILNMINKEELHGNGLIPS